MAGKIPVMKTSGVQQTFRMLGTSHDARNATSGGSALITSTVIFGIMRLRNQEQRVMRCKFGSVQSGGGNSGIRAAMILAGEGLMTPVVTLGRMRWFPTPWCWAAAECRGCVRNKPESTSHRGAEAAPPPERRESHTASLPSLGGGRVHPWKITVAVRGDGVKESFGRRRSSYTLGCH